MICKMIDKMTCTLKDNSVYDAVASDKEGITFIEVPEWLNPNYVKPVLINDLIELVEDVELKKIYLVSQAKASMWKDVLEAMSALYITNDMNSAQALQAIWSDMEAHPDLNTSALFPTAAHVTNYVAPKMILARQYAAFNLERRAQYEAEKAAILAME